MQKYTEREREKNRKGKDKKNEAEIFLRRFLAASLFKLLQERSKAEDTYSTRRAVSMFMEGHTPTLKAELNPIHQENGDWKRQNDALSFQNQRLLLNTVFASEFLIIGTTILLFKHHAYGKWSRAKWSAMEVTSSKT